MGFYTHEANSTYFPINIGISGTRDREVDGTEGPDGLITILHAHAWRHPRRIFYNPNNPEIIGRVALFSENDEKDQKWFRAYMETVFPLEGTNRETYRIFGAKTDVMEYEVERWRRAHSWTGDLTTNPTSVFRVAGQDDAFLHVGQTETGLLVWRYRITDQGGIPVTNPGPTVELRNDLDIPNIDIIRIPQPPTVLLRYASLTF